jgi:TMEM175 potassium channel family protein
MAEFSEDETVEARAFDYARTVALSDGIFAIALTLLVLNLTVPKLEAGHHDELGRKLLENRTELYCYALSFAVISLHWVRHHALFRAITRIDMRLTVLNLTYLGLVAFLPFPTGVLGTYGSAAASVVLYASTAAALAGLGALVRGHVLRANLVSGLGARMIASREHWAITPGIFLTSIPIAFLSPAAAELWWLLLLLPWARHRAG